MYYIQDYGICFPSVSQMTKEVDFTVPWLDKLKPPTQREDYRDKSTRGLQLRVSPTGIKSFSYAFRFGSKMGRVTLGKYPDLDLKTARQKTDEFRRLVLLGIDPRSEKRDKLAKQQMTVERMVTEFINQYAKPKNTSWKQAEGNLRLYLVSALGRQSIHDVKRPDIHSILDELVGRGKHTVLQQQTRCAIWRSKKVMKDVLPSGWRRYQRMIINYPTLPLRKCLVPYFNRVIPSPTHINIPTPQNRLLRSG